MTSLASSILVGKVMSLDLAHLRAPSPTKKLQIKQSPIRTSAIDINQWTCHKVKKRRLSQIRILAVSYMKLCKCFGNKCRDVE